MKLGKGRHSDLSSHVPTYVDLCLGIVGMVVLPGIKVGDYWGCVVGIVPVKHVGEHFSRDIVVEFLDLFLNVVQERIAGPATNHHDEKNWATPGEHCHSCSGTDGVCANLVSCNVE
jgi:hypothetical protein